MSTRTVNLIGNSPLTRDLLQHIDRVARSDAKVLITGESGVGKELVARMVHDRSPRAAKPFVALNCAGVPETLLESELFGHVRGSFTGAYRDKAGKLELADGGTIFLDEVGEMPLRMQGLLLRFLEVGELQKIGADTVTMYASVRVVAATNRDLLKMIEAGSFRQDLFYRLRVIHVEVPPLRARREDIPELVAHFLSLYGENPACVAREVSPDAMALLTRYHWPGNVRELQNVVESLAVACAREVIGVEDLPPLIRAASSTVVRPPLERFRTMADDLYERVTNGGESFWTAVYPLYMDREIARPLLRDIVRRGLRDAHGNYRVLMRLFNMSDGDYKRFLNFLRTHRCRVSYRDFRQSTAADATRPSATRSE